MRRFGWVAFALVFLMLAGATKALAEKRVALLIGNQSYAPEVGRLSNPGNDVALLEGVLKRLGFDVTTVRDAGLASLHQAVNAHIRRVRQSGPDTVGFFYYSGHGAADGVTNYLIPVDAKTIDDDQLWDQSLRLTEITRKLKDEAGNATHFVVFDACRNTLKLRKTGTKAIVQSKGFVPVSQESGMLIAYATAEGALASDVGTRAGPYATALTDEMVKPGVEAVAMFRNVQRRVRTAIGQEPYLGFNDLGDIYFAGQAPPVVPQAPVERPPTLTLFKCTMKGGVMDGKIYSFSIDAARRKAVWAEYGGVPLEILLLDDLRINTNAKIRIPGWPEHDFISFNFNRLTIVVQGVLARYPSADWSANCIAHLKEKWSAPAHCNNPLSVGEFSFGTCEVFARP